MQTVRASARYGRAIDAVSDLLARLRISSIFVGSVARSAWLGSRVEQGSVDLIAVMKPEQKNQVVMMGSHRGFRADCTTPSPVRLIASAGQTSAQVGESQCIQTTGMVWVEVARSR